MRAGGRGEEERKRLFLITSGRQNMFIGRFMTVVDSVISL